MKGKATLTLTNAKTGRVVKELEERNLVTDAVKRILQPPLYAAMYGLNYSSFVKAVMPASWLFSGIMLLGNTLTESKDNVMLDGSCIPVATAGSEYAGTDVRRGSLNSNETYATENGYHFTWDFGTDKANGVIKSIALTSRYMGDSGFNSSTASGKLIADPSSYKGTSDCSLRFCLARGQFIGTFQDRLHLYITYAGNTVTFLKYSSLNPQNVRLNDSVDTEDYCKAEFSREVELPISLYYSYKTFLDPGSKILFFFSKMYQDDNGNNKIDYAGVSLDTFTLVANGTQTVDPSTKYVYSCAVYNRKFYLATSSSIHIYTLNGGLKKMISGSVTSTVWFSAAIGMLSATIGYHLVAMFTDDDQMLTYYNCTTYLPAYSSDIKPPYFPMQYHENRNSESENTSRNPHLGVAMDYLATINNLSSPIEKTSEHNLKITYDITN